MTTFACIASGPSLIKADIDQCIAKGWKIAACNNAWTMCDKLDVFLAHDVQWWKRYGLKVSKVGADMWTPNPVIANKHRCNVYAKIQGEGFSTERAKCCGRDSGSHLLQAASWHGATRIIMLGYDMQHTDGQSHFHGDHPNGWANAENVADWLETYDALAQDAERQGIELINCTRETAITSIPRCGLVEVE